MNEDNKRSPAMFRFYKVTIFLMVAGGLAYGALLSAADGDNGLALIKILWFVVFYVLGAANVFTLLDDAREK